MFIAIKNGCNPTIGHWGKLIDEKTGSQKSSVRVPVSKIFLTGI